MKLPPAIVKVIEAARKVIRLRLELRRSVEDEASDRVLAKRRHDVQQALDALEKAVEVFEKDLSVARSQRTVKTDWAGVFRAGEALLDMFSKVKRKDPSVVNDARRWVERYSPGDVIDGEVIE